MVLVQTQLDWYLEGNWEPQSGSTTALSWRETAISSDREVGYATQEPDSRQHCLLSLAQRAAHLMSILHWSPARPSPLWLSLSCCFVTHPQPRRYTSQLNLQKWPFPGGNILVLSMCYWKHTQNYAWVSVHGTFDPNCVMRMYWSTPSALGRGGTDKKVNQK